MTLQMPQLPGPLPTWLTGCRTPGVGRQAGVQCAIEAGLAWLANEWESEVKPAKPPGCAIHHQPAERNYDLHFNLPGGFLQVREGGRCGERGLCAVGQSMHVSHPRCVALRGSIYLRGRCACGMEQDQSCVSCSALLAVLSLLFRRPVPGHMVVVAETRMDGYLEAPVEGAKILDDTLLRLAKANAVTNMPHDQRPG